MADEHDSPGRPTPEHGHREPAKKGHHPHAHSHAHAAAAGGHHPARHAPAHGGGKNPAHAEQAGDHGRKHGAPWHRRPGLVALIILVLIVLIVGGVLWWRHSRSYESTDDAAIDVPAQRVSPQVAGRVLQVLVNDNQDVTRGQVLVVLDSLDFQTRLESAQAAVAQAQAQVAEAEAQRLIIEAQREQARANQEAVAANATAAADDLQRFKSLQGESSGAVSQQQFDRAVADAAGSAAQLRAAGRSVAAAEAQLGYVQQQIEAARAAVRSAEAQVAQARLTLSYAQVRAGLDGRVARKTVAPGNYVSPGTDLMAVVPREVYVVANFKETQLAHMRPGQRVRVRVDSFPSLKLTGRVDSVQPATGQVFDQLPSQNAAGNWVKVVQRVPVKITLDQLPADPQRLAPGMSVTVRVSLR